MYLLSLVLLAALAFVTDALAREVGLGGYALRPKAGNTALLAREAKLNNARAQTGSREFQLKMEALQSMYQRDPVEFLQDLAAVLVQQRKLVLGKMEVGTSGKIFLLDREVPKYPFEPLLDENYILDADNYLEDFINATDIPAQLWARYTSPSPSSASTTLPRGGSSARTRNASAYDEGALPLSSSANDNTGEQQAARWVTVKDCVTRADPRLERPLQFFLRAKPAPEGTPCIFGVTPKDEGSHCIYDDGRYGSFGWCYTRADATEWGSCSEECPLEGSNEVLASRIDRLTKKVHDMLAILASEKTREPAW